MTLITASDCQQKIKAYAKRQWPLDKDKTAAPKLQNAINSILRKMAKDDDERQFISTRRAKSYLNGEPTAKLRGWEVEAIRELLEGATDEETKLFEELQALRATVERQGKIIDRLTRFMDRKGA